MGTDQDRRYLRRDYVTQKWRRVGHNARTNDYTYNKKLMIPNENAAQTEDEQK